MKLLVNSFCIAFLLVSAHTVAAQIYLATDVTFSNLVPDGDLISLIAVVFFTRFASASGVWTNLRYCGWDATSIACPTTAWSCSGQPTWFLYQTRKNTPNFQI